MTYEQKTELIAELAEKFQKYDFFYVTDSSTLPVHEINNFRRLCFQKGVEVKAVKNSLIKKALEKVEGRSYSEAFLKELKGHSTVIFSDNSNLPAKILKEYRTNKEHGRPLLKIAYIDNDIFVGDDQLESLVALKSKFELIGDLIGLLQSPAKNVVSGLQSGGAKLAGILETLSDKES